MDYVYHFFILLFLDRNSKFSLKRVNTYIYFIEKGVRRREHSYDVQEECAIGGSG